MYLIAISNGWLRVFGLYASYTTALTIKRITQRKCRSERRHKPDKPNSNATHQYIYVIFVHPYSSAPFRCTFYQMFPTIFLPFLPPSTFASFAPGTLIFSFVWQFYSFFAYLSLDSPLSLYLGQKNALLFSTSLIRCKTNAYSSHFINCLWLTPTVFHNGTIWRQQKKQYATKVLKNNCDSHFFY